ncbi:unnamed protein product [Rotaria sp. Silwood1]|nr:unnamed protein product [Rotaria sp. Silwood1]CAF1650903.1 unnamed protein product [Rotaria sp. Silwood1]
MNFTTMFNNSTNIKESSKSNTTANLHIDEDWTDNAIQTKSEVWIKIRRIAYRLIVQENFRSMLLSVSTFHCELLQVILETEQLIEGFKEYTFCLQLQLIHKIMILKCPLD